MLGKNQLHLNVATMCEVVQRYLDIELTDTPKVTGVTWSKDDKTFKIELDSEALSQLESVKAAPARELV